MRLFGALLAAGASRRFGAENKLLAGYRGRALVLHAAEALRGAGCAALAAVVSAPEVEAILPPDFARLRIDPGAPMADSFKAAVRAAQAAEAEALLICLGDMPEVSADLLRRLTAEGGGRSRACLHAGRRLPPALIVAADFPDALRAEGDQGARPLLAALPPEALLPISAREAADVDAAADLAALEAAYGGER